MRRAPIAAILLLVVAVLGVGCATVSLLESVESILAKAKELLDAKRYDEALTQLAEVIRRDPAQWKATRQEFTRTLLAGGKQALTTGDARGAIPLLREYVRAEPRDVNAYVDLGKAYLTTGETGEAFSALRRVLELAPQNEEARRLLLGR